MSTSINDNLVDDKELNEYLGGDTQYSRRYSALEAHAVPADLDSLVLANAATGSVTGINAATRQRVDERRRTNSLSNWMRAGVPVALAASVVLAISIMMDGGTGRNPSVTGTMEVQSPTAAQPLEFAAEPASEMPPRTDAAPIDAITYEDLAQLGKQKAEAAPAKKLAESSSSESRALPKALVVEPTTQNNAQEKTMASDAFAREEAVQPSAPLAAAAAPAAAANANQSSNANASTGVVTSSEADKSSRAARSDAALKLEEVIVTGARRVDQRGGAGPRNSIPPDSFDEREPSDAEIAKERREANPASWLGYIRELRSSGKSRAADREWQRFVKAYPAYSVDAADTARPGK